MYYKIRPGITLLIGLMTLVTIARAQVAINTTGDAAHASAMLEVSSNNKGILIPRMTTAERTAIVNPASGLLVFDTTTNSFWYFHGTSAEWQQIGTSVAGASELDELSDVISDGSSLFLGSGVGVNDAGSNANTAIGVFAFYDNTSGNSNTAIGYSSLNRNASGQWNTATGANSLRNNISGLRNTAIGYSAMRGIITGADNTAIGSEALYTNSTGINNIAIGSSAARSSTSGFKNVCIGSFSDENNQEGSQNTILGYMAGRGTALHSKSGSVFLGYLAGYNETSDNKLYIENSSSSTPLIGGDFANDSLFFNGVVRITGGNPGANKVLTSDANGNATWEANDGGATSIDELSDGIQDEGSLFLGNEAGDVDDGNNFNTGIGYNAMYSNTSGNSNTGVGTWALRFNTVGHNNTAFGMRASESNTSGSFNTSIGRSALTASQTGDYNTVIGNEVAASNTTGDYNVCIGSGADYYNLTGSRNTIVGFESGYGSYAHGKTGNVLIGFQAGYFESDDDKLYIENSSSNTPLIGGDFANDSLFFNGVVRITGGNPGANKVLTSDEHGNATWEANDGGANSIDELSDGKRDNFNGLFLGNWAGWSNQSYGNIGIGDYALNDNTGGEYNTALGCNSLELNANGSKNTAIGYHSLTLNRIGDNNTAVGHETLSFNESGTNNVGVGVFSLGSNFNGHYNTAVGFYSLAFNSSGQYNTAFGGRSLYFSNGERNTATGYAALYNNSSGSYNTAIGYRTMYSNTTGSNNTALGYNCGPSGANFSNTTAVGNEATTTASNMVRIGNASVTSIGGYAAWTNVSDQRFKNNIREDVSGLDFILKLRPVTYNLDVQQLSSFLGVESQSTDQQAMSEKSAIRQSGFIAQEVEEVAQQLGYEFSGIDAPKNENDHYGLRYAEFVVPLVKAVQELAAENEKLKMKIEALESK